MAAKETAEVAQRLLVQAISLSLAAAGFGRTSSAVAQTKSFDIGRPGNCNRE
jgi:hypothetical protein